MNIVTEDVQEPVHQPVVDKVNGMFSNRKAIFLIFLTIVGYMAVRWVVYSVTEGLYGQFFIRDNLMTIPRLVGFVFILWIGWRQRPGHYLDFSFKKARVSLFIFFIWILIDLLTLIDHPFLSRSLKLSIVFALTTIPVALFEETLFRGALLHELRNLGLKLWSVPVSALIFALFHFQAITIDLWPNIFFWGIVAGALRYYKASMCWLVLMHWGLDYLALFVGMSKTGISYWLQLVASSVLAVSLLWYVKAESTREHKL